MRRLDAIRAPLVGVAARASPRGIRRRKVRRFGAGRRRRAPKQLRRRDSGA